jgi:hypothetical protein
MAKNLICDGCKKEFKELMGYGTKLLVCIECFEKADARAALGDRWPEDRDFLDRRET